MSRLNSQVVASRLGTLGRVEEVGGGLPVAPDQMLLDGRPVDEQGWARPHTTSPRNGWAEGRVDCSTSASRQGIELIALDVVDAAPPGADPARRVLDPPEHVLLGQDVVAEVDSPVCKTARAVLTASPPPLTSSGSKKGRGGCDSGGFQLRRGWRRPGLKLHHPVGSRTDGLESSRAPPARRTPGATGRRRGKQAVPREGPQSQKGWVFFKTTFTVWRRAVHARDVVVGGATVGGGGRIGRELPVEDHVVGGEGGAVVPGDALALEPPPTHCPSGATARRSARLGSSLREARGRKLHRGVPPPGARRRFAGT